MSRTIDFRRRKFHDKSNIFHYPIHIMEKNPIIIIFSLSRSFQPHRNERKKAALSLSFNFGKYLKVWHAINSELLYLREYWQFKTSPTFIIATRIIVMWATKSEEENEESFPFRCVLRWLQLFWTCSMLLKDFWGLILCANLRIMLEIIELDLYKRAFCVSFTPFEA